MIFAVIKVAHATRQFNGWEKEKQVCTSRRSMCALIYHFSGLHRKVESRCSSEWSRDHTAYVQLLVDAPRQGGTNRGKAAFALFLFHRFNGRVRGDKESREKKKNVRRYIRWELNAAERMGMRARREEREEGDEWKKVNKHGTRPTHLLLSICPLVDSSVLSFVSYVRCLFLSLASAPSFFFSLSLLLTFPSAFFARSNLDLFLSFTLSCLSFWWETRDTHTNTKLLDLVLGSPHCCILLARARGPKGEAASIREWHRRSIRFFCWRPRVRKKRGKNDVDKNERDKTKVGRMSKKTKTTSQSSARGEGQKLVMQWSVLQGGVRTAGARPLHTRVDITVSEKNLLSKKGNSSTFVWFSSALSSSLLPSLAHHLDPLLFHFFLDVWSFQPFSSPHAHTRIFGLQVHPCSLYSHSLPNFVLIEGCPKLVKNYWHADREKSAGLFARSDARSPQSHFKIALRIRSSSSHSVPENDQSCCDRKIVRKIKLFRQNQ